MVGIPNDKKLGSRLAPGQLSAQTAFEALKQVLTQAPILAYADFTQAFIVYTDASHQGFGAVLAQIQEGKERVIAYASRSLHPTERNDANYSSFKLELLALKWAIGDKDHLTGAKFVVFTDDNPVAHLQSARLGAVEQRWVAQLASFDFEVKYRAGKENANVDALSWFPVSAGPSERISISAVTAAGPDDTPEDLCEWETAQMTDPDI